MKNILKVGLILIGLMLSLNASDKVISEIEKTNESVKSGINVYKEQSNESNTSLNKDALNQVVKDKANEKSNIDAITYITNTDGTIDVKINLSSTELNLTTIESLKSIVSSIKKNKNINKVYIDTETIK